MACFAVIILSGFISISAAREPCDLYGGVGQSLTLPLHFTGRPNKNALRWNHNTKTLFSRDINGQVSVGKAGDVSANGSLELKNLQFSNAGSYEAHVQYRKGTFEKVWSCRVSVMDKVSKPQLTYVCDLQSSTVNLNCNVSRPQGLDFSWRRDETSLTQDVVRLTCTSPSSSPPNLLCLPSKTVVAAVTGGVSLILLLISIIVGLCFYYRCNKTQKGLREKGAIRMLSLNKLERNSVSPDYETMNPTEIPLPPSPKPSPRACYQNVPPPEAQPGNGPVQLSTVAQRQQPSPVPKPRTKTTNIGLCLPQETFSDKEKNVKFAF